MVKFTAKQLLRSKQEKSISDANLFNQKSVISGKITHSVSAINGPAEDNILALCNSIIQ